MAKMNIFDKINLRALILQQLQADRALLLQAASAAHAAATHAENIPDNKYETLSIEADYIAQGQANRAQDISTAIERFRQFEPRTFPPDSSIRLGALVLLEDEERQTRQILLGPAAGGLKLSYAQAEIWVITPDSPLGSRLLGKQVGDTLDITAADRLREYEILDIC